MAVLPELVICHLLAALLVWAAALVLGLPRCHVMVRTLGSETGLMFRIVLA